MENIKLYAVGTICVCMTIVFFAMLYCRRQLHLVDNESPEREFELTVLEPS
jgi:hypothetical protein